MESVDKIKMHQQLCSELNEIYAKKNHDYGDSFGESFKEWGILAAMVRMSDKWNRLKTLIRLSEDNRKVQDEKITDTILDLCNYLLMTHMELILQRKEKRNNGED